MHIPDGILPLPVTLTGYAVSIGAVWYCTRQIKKRGDPREHIPKAALLAAAFFSVTLIQIPIPPTSVHLLLCGLMGVLLGFFAMPAILVALFFQAVMFGHGGLTTLGVNGIILGLPALSAALFFRMHDPLNGSDNAKTAIFGFVAGSVAAALSVAVFSLFIFNTIPAHMDATAEKTAIMALIFAHIPVIIIEGVVTAFIVVFLRQSKPQLLEGL